MEKKKKPMILSPEEQELKIHGRPRKTKFRSKKGRSANTVARFVFEANSRKLVANIANVSYSTPDATGEILVESASSIAASLVRIHGGNPYEETFEGMASRTRDRGGIPSRLIVFRGLWFSSAMPIIRSKTQRCYSEHDVPGSGLTTLTSRG